MEVQPGPSKDPNPPKPKTNESNSQENESKSKINKSKFKENETTEKKLPQKKDAPKKMFGKKLVYSDCVHVSGYPFDLTELDLYNLLKKFGPMHKNRLYNFNSMETIVNYIDNTSAQKVLSINEKEIIPGLKMKIRLATEEDFRFAKTREKEDLIIDPRSMKLSGTFEEQLEEILATIRLTREEVVHISTLYMDVARALQSKFPGCRAIPFGSITTGLGTKSSDADCFVEIPPSSQRPGSNYVQVVKKALNRMPHVFSETLAIPNASIPIVKFHHLQTRTNCDLSFKSPLGTKNSNLIAFYLRMDPRLIPLNILLKYLFKYHDLSGKGKLSNYALTMLMIFYLQQGPLPILPSVEYLQFDRRYDCYVDGWNTGFNSNFVGSTQNRQSVKELFLGFIEFYAEFDFKRYVVSPFLGKPVEIECFQNLQRLPPSFRLYAERLAYCDELPIKISNSMCIQDPFQLNRNVSSAIFDRLAHEMREHLKWMASAYKQLVSENEESSFLKYILTNKPKITKLQETPQYKISVKKRVLEKIVDASWVDVGRDIINTIFVKFLLFDYIKKEKEDETSFTESLTITCQYRSWCRKPARKVVNAPNLNYLERELLVTDYIIKNTNKIDESKEKPLTIDVTNVYHKKSQEIVMIIKYISGSAGFYTELGTALIEFVHHTFLQLIYLRNKNADILKSKPDTDGMSVNEDDDDGRKMSANESDVKITEDDSDQKKVTECDNDRKMSETDIDSDRNISETDSDRKSSETDCDRNISESDFDSDRKMSETDN